MEFVHSLRLNLEPAKNQQNPQLWVVRSRGGMRHKLIKYVT